MPVFVKAYQRGKTRVRGYSRIEPAVGGGGSKGYGGHAFRLTTRKGTHVTVFRHGKYSDVAKRIKQLQNKMRAGINHIQHLS